MRKGVLSKKPLVVRFWEKVKATDGCWVWTGARFNHGYGQIRVLDKLKLAHRFSYELHRGEIPGDMLVLHLCDNPVCVRPDHLFLGTDKDNSDDMIKKGRARYGPHTEETKRKIGEASKRMWLRKRGVVS